MSDAGITALFMFGSLVVFLLIGVPTAFCTMLASIFYLIFTDLRPLVAVVQTSCGGMGSFSLLAVPMFMLAGFLMESSGISRRLVDWVWAMAGNMRGSVGVVTIVSCALFAALTGSAPATVTAIGAIMLPALIETGYSKSTACGILAAGGCLGPIIPPSIPMLIYGSTMRLSIPAMFLGGVFPGLLITAGYIAVHHYYVKNKWNIITIDKQYTTKEKIILTWKALPSLGMPVLILGGIYGGVFTPTEAAAIAVFYATIVGFILKDLTIKTFIAAIRRTALMGAAIGISVGGGFTFTYIMGTTGVPQALTMKMVPLMHTQFIYLVVLSIILFIAGCLLDSIVIIILLAPILVPIGLQLGVDPLHLGVVYCVNITIGAITPPFGACLFTATRISNQSYESVVRGVVPFLAVAVVLVIFITFCPFITSWLPNQLGM